jgi:hypothetical protein
MMRTAFAFLATTVALQAVPVFAQSDQDVCEILADEARTANEEAPLMVDDFTREDSTTVSCANKTLETRLTVVAAAASLPADWRDRRQNELNELYCEDELTADSMADGWIFMQAIAMPDGTSLTLKAACE